MAEINGNFPNTGFASYYRTIQTEKNSLYKWSFWHRGRHGIDTARVWVNNESNIVSDENGTTEFLDNNSAWGYHQGHINPENSSEIKLGFQEYRVSDNYYYKW
ncbi:hypothetical protein AZF37_00885 [endosymbiont 'TC1' of Trimyema compressum]|uniref:hypothetical protein n=1 Tax=endosymbiont 'TC1' of Trimyema compressum TaxID=243899 RepID=UPI0007F059FC|nr:hypothetical protein [endosymbiont 'TC1' of Trimyema compressum]AMP19925.1 hypothetical protein AZF37_00885 [endosymbiont 'TC1' of Trimyema compressum]